MLPTPSTSHVSFDTIYEPAEDSYLFLDTLSSVSEAAWLSERFSSTSTSQGPAPPLVVEVGSGSGVVLAFAVANSKHIFGRDDILTLATDVNSDACKATRQTVNTSIDEKKQESGTRTLFTGSLLADLVSPLRPGSVDVLLFNPPYVPTPELPPLPTESTSSQPLNTRESKFEHESYLLSLSYAGGVHGMETTNRFLDAIPYILNPDRGVAYVLLCAQNKPEDIKARIRRDWNGWTAESVGKSGVQAGWEKLVIVRICREPSMP